MLQLVQATDPGEHSATRPRSARRRAGKGRQREVERLPARVEAPRWRRVRGPRRDGEDLRAQPVWEGSQRQIWEVITLFSMHNSVLLNRIEINMYMVWICYVSLCVGADRAMNRDLRARRYRVSRINVFSGFLHLYIAKWCKVKFGPQCVT